MFKKKREELKKVQILRNNITSLEKLLTHPELFLYDGNYSNVIKILNDVKRRERDYGLTQPQKYAIGSILKRAMVNLQYSSNLQDVEEAFEAKNTQEAYDECFKLTALLQMDFYTKHLQPMYRQKTFDLLRKIGDKLEEVPSDLPETSFSSHKKPKEISDQETTISTFSTPSTPTTTFYSHSKETGSETYFSSHSSDKNNAGVKGLEDKGTHITQFPQATQFKSITNEKKINQDRLDLSSAKPNSKPAPLYEFDLRVKSKEKTEIIKFGKEA